MNLPVYVNGRCSVCGLSTVHRDWCADVASSLEWEQFVYTPGRGHDRCFAEGCRRPFFDMGFCREHFATSRYASRRSVRGAA